MANTIKVPFPHMALNSHNVPPPDYLMFNTWKVASDITVDHIVGWVRKVALGMPGGQISTLIFNAHGRPGFISLGKGIKEEDLHKFQLWKTEKGSLIKEIWIVACLVAGESKFTSGGPSGERFCKDLALATGAFVTAAVREQRAEIPTLPIGFIDEWEGEVRKYDKNGNKIILQQDNASYQ